MMRRGMLAVLVALAGAATEAHHSLSGIYDTRERVTFVGTIAEFHLVRPHPYLLFDVAVDGSRLERRRGELDNLGELAAIGVSADTFRPGDRVEVTGSPGRRSPESVYVWRLDRAADGFWYEQVGSRPGIGFRKDSAAAAE